MPDVVNYALIGSLFVQSIALRRRDVALAGLPYVPALFSVKDLWVQGINVDDRGRNVQEQYRPGAGRRQLRIGNRFIVADHWRSVQRQCSHVRFTPDNVVGSPDGCVSSAVGWSCRSEK